MNLNEIKREFDNLYDFHIYPRLDEFEGIRIAHKKIYDKYHRNCYLSLLIGLLGLICAAIPFLNIIAVVFFVLGFILPYNFMVKSIKAMDAFRKDIKSNVLSVLFSPFGSFNTSDDAVISLDELKKIGLSYSAKKKQDDDVIVGKYKGLPISFTETRASCGGKNDYTDFNGVVIKIQMDKYFDGVTILRPKDKKNGLANIVLDVSEKNPDLFPPQVLNYFFPKNKGFMHNLAISGVNESIEDKREGWPIVDKLYDCYTDNKNEATLLLTPELVERFKKLQALLLVENIECMFRDNYVYLVIDNYSSVKIKGYNMYTDKIGEIYSFFEAGSIMHTLKNSEIYYKTFKEIYCMFDFIDYFAPKEVEEAV